jgi:hypothetical protein
MGEMKEEIETSERASSSRAGLPIRSQACNVARRLTAYRRRNANSPVSGFSVVG